MRWVLGALLIVLPAHAQEPREPVQVVRVVDGDTIRVKNIAGTEIKVRLIGIDTPEVHKDEHLTRQAAQLGASPDELEKVGELATQRATELVGKGPVWLEYDQDREDRYGRTLAYVWLDEQTMLNEKMLDEGLAVTMFFKPNLKNQARFEQRASSAREGRVGLWAPVAQPEKTTRTPPKPRREPEPESEEDFPVGIAVGLLLTLGMITAVGLVALRSRPPVKDEDGPYL